MSTSTQKKKHIKAVRPKVRAKEPMLSVFMWGINYSMSELTHVKIPIMLMPDDFKSYMKVRVDNHTFNKENLPSHFKFKEYCPLVFRKLRERFGITEEKYLKSLTSSCPIDNASTTPTGPGSHTGPRLLTSYDRHFFMKTIQSEQVAEMHRILTDYHQHIVECQTETRLPQYLGMYRVTVNDTVTYLVVMRNIFSPRIVVHRKYDLKGSVIDRQASEKEKQKTLPTFKDKDFLGDGRMLYVGPEVKRKLISVFQADAELLSRLNLMDYSLLVGIHNCDLADNQQQQPPDLGDGVATLSDGDYGNDELDSSGSAGTPPDSPIFSPRLRKISFTASLDPLLEFFAIKSSEHCSRHEIYFIGIIDILTGYGIKKRTAQAAKTVKHGSRAEISTVRPEQYARRLVEFIDKIVE